VSPENLAAGLKFSWPTYKSGLRVMIHAQLQTGSTWAFSEIFRWEVGGLHGTARGFMPRGGVFTGASSDEPCVSAEWQNPGVSDICRGYLRVMICVASVCAAPAPAWRPRVDSFSGESINL
jgi:hypothetical protein